MFLDHTQRRSTRGRTPLDEWSARRRDLYLTTHDTHNRQISMPPVGFEPPISAGERPAACGHRRQFGACAIHPVQLRPHKHTHTHTHTQTHTHTNTHTHTHTIRILNTYCLSTAKMVARTRLSVKLLHTYIACLVVSSLRLQFCPCKSIHSSKQH